MHWSVLRMARKVVCHDDDEFLFQDAFVQAAASAAARNPYVGERQTRPKDARRLRYLMSRPSWTSKLVLGKFQPRVDFIKVGRRA